MKTIHILILLIVLALVTFAQNTGLNFFLSPGPFAFCQVYDNPILCGVWKEQGKPITYELIISTTNPSAVAFSYVVSGMDKSGVAISRSGVVQRTDGYTVVNLSFIGAIVNPKIEVQELGII